MSIRSKNFHVSKKTLSQSFRVFFSLRFAAFKFFAQLSFMSSFHYFFLPLFFFFPLSLSLVRSPYLAVCFRATCFNELTNRSHKAKLLEKKRENKWVVAKRLRSNSRYSQTHQNMKHHLNHFQNGKVNVVSKENTDTYLCAFLDLVPYWRALHHVERVNH